MFHSRTHQRTLVKYLKKLGESQYFNFPQLNIILNQCKKHSSVWNIFKQLLAESCRCVVPIAERAILAYMPNLNFLSIAKSVKIKATGLKNIKPYICY